MRVLAIPVLAVALLGAPAEAAQDAPPRLQRQDMAQVFTRLDAACAPLGLSSPDWRTWNHEFDGIALEFFRGRLLEATDRMVGLRARVLGLTDEDAIAHRVAASIRLRVAAPHARTSELELVGLWPVLDAATSQVAVTVRLVVDGAAPTRLPVEVAVGADGRVTPTRLSLPDLEAASREATLVLLDPAGEPHARAFWTPSEETWTARRERLLASVEAIEAGDDEDLADALACFRSRCALLQENESERRSLAVFTSPRALWDQLEGEAGDLRAGRDPYRAERVAGEALLWRSIPFEGRELFTVQRIAPTAGPDDRRPLVIALHGAGGDEAFFAAAAGGGALVEASRRHGFHLTCPHTNQMLYDWAAFDALLADALARYPVDPERVYVLGHSLGAMTTAGLLKVRGEAITRASLIAGIRPLRGDTPVLVQAAALDRIFPVDPVRSEVRASRDRGVPVELEVLEDTGHVLVLGPAVARALAWFGLTDG